MKTFSQPRQPKQARPVSTKLPGQAKNDGGGNAFITQDWVQLDRFLILGTTAPTYYAAGSKNLNRNLPVLNKCLTADGPRYISRLAEIDDKNLAVHRGTLIFALALALKKGDVDTRRMAEGLAKTMIRTGRDIATFAAEINNLGGWGRLTRRTVAQWYTDKGADDLAYQIAKYRNTGADTFSHRDILRLTHVKTESPVVNNMFAYLVGKEHDPNLLPLQIRLFEAMKGADENTVIKAIVQGKLTHEMIPTEFKKSAAVWGALADNMPFRALVWNLSTFSELGMLKEMSVFERFVLGRLRNEKAVIGSRIHPMTLLVAMRNYQRGSGERKSWPVNRRVVAALEDALLILFNNVEKTAGSVACIVDTSGSMSSNYGWGRSKSTLAGAGIKPIEAAAVLAAVQGKKSDAYMLGVDTQLHKIDIRPNSSLADVVKTFGKYQGGATNLGLALEHLIREKINVDCIVYYTDNEVNRGKQVVDLFTEYQRKVNRNARFVAVAFEANNFTIAVPNRDDMLDVCGFDSNTVNVINAFVEREF